MAIKLTCPGCHDSVSAEEGERGTKIKCGTCWADVDVPQAVATAKPIILPTAKPLSTAGPTAAAPPAAATPAGSTPKANPLPVTAAKPTVATAIPVSTARVATPVDPKGKARSDDGGAKPRFKERDRDHDYDDDDDDRPRKAGAKRGGGGVLIAFIAIGGVMVLGLAGGIALLVMNSNQPDVADATPSTTGDDEIRLPLRPNPRPNPNPGDFPKPPATPPAIRPAGWVEYRAKNFSCDMPGPVSTGPIGFDFAAKHITGDGFFASERDQSVKVVVKEIDLPPGTSATNEAFVAASLEIPEAELTKDPNGRLVGRNPGVEYTARTADGYDNAVLAVGVGTKTGFLFRIRWKPGTPDAEKKRDNFLASVSVTLVGDTPVVVGPGGRPDPKQPKPITVAWKPLENDDGFTVDAPPGAKKERHLLELPNRQGRLSGKKWGIDDGDVAYHIYYHDLAPEQLEIDLKQIASPLVHSVFPHEVNAESEAKVDGHPATRWDIRHFHGGISHGVSVRIGYRVFTLFCTSKQGIFNGTDATLNDRQDRFLNSIKFTFDPKTHDPYAGEPEWVAMAKTTGFTASVPKQATSRNEFKPFFGFDVPVGQEWKVDVDGIVYQAFLIDLTPIPNKRFNQPDKTPADVIKWFTDRERIEEGPINTAKLGLLNAEGYTLKAGESQSHLRVLTNGPLFYALKVTRSGDWNSKCGDKEFADKSAKFFSHFALGEGVTVVDGGPGATPGEMPGGVPGEFVVLADGKVQPFWTGVFLPSKKEFISIGVKDTTARPVRSILRRYSLPDFTLKATYTLPMPICRAVADEKNGLLYTVGLKDPKDATADEKDALIGTADVYYYDLNKLTDGSVTEGDMVRYENSISTTGLKVSGLVVAPDSSAVYISGVMVTGTPARPILRGRLLKWVTADKKLEQSIATDMPIWAMSISQDGETVVAVERSMDPAKPGGNVVEIHGPEWKRTFTTPLNAPPYDVTTAAGNVVAAANVGPGQGKLIVTSPEGKSAEVNAGGDATYAWLTPDGKRLLVAAGLKASGLTLYEVDGSSPPKLTKAAYSGELGGQVVLSPDGKLAVTNTGKVLDLGNTKGK